MKYICGIYFLYMHLYASPRLLLSKGFPLSIPLQCFTLSALLRQEGPEPTQVLSLLVVY